MRCLFHSGRKDRTLTRAVLDEANGAGECDKAGERDEADRPQATMNESEDGLPSQIAANGRKNGVLVNSKPADGTMANRAVADGATADNTTADDTTADNTTADGATADGITADGATADGITADGATADGITADRAKGAMADRGQNIAQTRKSTKAAKYLSPRNCPLANKGKEMDQFTASKEAQTTDDLDLPKISLCQSEIVAPEVAWTTSSPLLILPPKKRFRRSISAFLSHTQAGDLTSNKKASSKQRRSTASTKQRRVMTASSSQSSPVVLSGDGGERAATALPRRTRSRLSQSTDYGSVSPAHTNEPVEELRITPIQKVQIQ